MPNTFTLIASSTVGSGGAANIDFSSIPSTYTDLCLKFSGRNTSNASVVYFTFNNTASSRSAIILYGSGSSTGSLSGGDSDARFALTSQSDYTANTFGNCEIYIPNYAGSNNKSFSSDSIQENNGTTAYAYLVAGLWANTSAINRVTMTPISGSFAQYSTAYLYGIVKS